MKRILFLTVTLLMLFSMITCINAQGEIIGEVLNTDIIAYIDGLPIQSYNINGWTGIVAEDLRNYGFEVYWFEEERALYISYYQNPGFTIIADYVPQKNDMPVGSHAMDVFKTDIKTYVAGEEAEGYNIGGETIIFIDWLQCYGDVQWVESERKICYTPVEPWDLDLHNTNYDADTSGNINSFSLNAVKNENNTFDSNGENLDYLTYIKMNYSKKNGMQFSFSLYQRVLFQTEELNSLLWNMSTTRYDGTVLQTDVGIANEHMKILINGDPVKITQVTQGKGNGHTDFYFWLDSSLPKEEIKTINVECK
ncbi:MAG: hypothetical protein M0R40_00280 [Firmicutes bacterium]|nr:hypothetical protein [Bacillota bacterium]